jgi:hypothetical protein
VGTFFRGSRKQSRLVGVELRPTPGRAEEDSDHGSKDTCRIGSREDHWENYGHNEHDTLLRGSASLPPAHYDGRAGAYASCVRRLRRRGYDDRAGVYLV